LLLTQLSKRGKQIEKLLETNLLHLMHFLDLTNPIKILQRGFALVRSKNNNIVTSKISALQAFNESRELKMIFSDGDLMITDIKQLVF
jgi:exonuclease VII large subunit